MGGFNIGDILFQLFSFGFLILLIFLIVFLFRSFTRRGKQLDQLEKKVDSISERVNRNN
jgi:energy-converting hydrogenase Eha subunit H